MIRYVWSFALLQSLSAKNDSAFVYIYNTFEILISP